MLPVVCMGLDAIPAVVHLGVVSIHESAPAVVAALPRIDIASRHAIKVVARCFRSAAWVSLPGAVNRRSELADIFVEVKDWLPFFGPRRGLFGKSVENVSDRDADEGWSGEEDGGVHGFWKSWQG
jgi:hypothetical protein